MITLYSTPRCPQCDATKRWLAKNGTSYIELDITDNSDARDYVMALGYLSAPVVVAGADHWSGFRPDRLDKLGSAA